jgi:hypothetical protein
MKERTFLYLSHEGEDLPLPLQDEEDLSYLPSHEGEDLLQPSQTEGEVPFLSHQRTERTFLSHHTK